MGWVVPFQHCAQQPHPAFKMAPVTKYIHFFNCEIVQIISNFKCRCMSISSPTYLPCFSLNLFIQLIYANWTYFYKSKNHI
jgi:hypothetical protein